MTLLKPNRWHYYGWIAILFVYLTTYVPIAGWKLALVRGTSNLFVLSLLFYFCFWIYNRASGSRLQWQDWLPILIALSLLTFVRIALNNSWIPGEQLPFDSADRRVAMFWLSMITNSGIVILSYLVFQGESRRKTELHNQELVLERQSAELLQLRSQINPHFLFNALHNIYSLSVVASDRAPDMILKLSDLLRYVTYEGQRNQVALSKEIQQLEHYIDLFQLRSHDQLNIKLENRLKDQALLIEPMLLLPLVENAFKHGDFIRNQEAYAHFEVKKEGIFVLFQGENSFLLHEEQKDEQSGVGLRNIDSRLKLVYGEEAFLRFESPSSKNVFTFTLGIPYQQMLNEK